MAKSGRTSSKKRTRKPSSKVSKVKLKKAFRTYKQAVSYLTQRTNYETEKHLRYNVTTFSLDRMEKLLTLLGDPHKKIRTAHIAGTKGKGSTATMLARMLESNSYKVGLYTSPHLLNLHERISVDNKPITDSEMLALMNRVYAAVEEVAKEEMPTFFELMTALAFLHFADCEVDIAVVETGLGGRLDSTNVIKPAVVGITSLSLDHQNQLGQTLAEITTEKAGILKKGVPAVTVFQEPEAMKVLTKTAAAIDAPLSVAGGDIDFSYRFETSREYGPHTRICLTTPTSKFEHLRVPLHGKHQAINCGLALALLDRLKLDGFPIDNEKTMQGLNRVELPGRMEMICRDPRILIDGAHNAESIRALMQAIGQSIAYDSMVVVFGCNQDKDVRGMLRKLQLGADKVIFTRSASLKSMMPEELADIYTEMSGKMCQTASNLTQAMKLAQSAVGREDLICVTGSFYLIGQAKARFQKNNPETK